MISAVDEQRQHRERSKSAASGPPFSLPALTGIADIMALGATAPTSAPVCAPSPATTATPSANTDLTAYLGRSVGTGQCVALVQAAQPAIGHTSNWSPGASVQGNTTLAPGTPIATFNAANRYANATDGSSHAAIYLGQDSHGIQVLDQWAGSAAAIRTIPWNNAGAAAANTGTAYRTIRT